MKLLSLEPESSASANSAIPANSTEDIISLSVKFVKEFCENRPLQRNLAQNIMKLAAAAFKLTQYGVDAFRLSCPVDACDGG